MTPGEPRREASAVSHLGRGLAELRSNRWLASTATISSALVCASIILLAVYYEPARAPDQAAPAPVASGNLTTAGNAAP